MIFNLRLISGVKLVLCSIVIANLFSCQEESSENHREADSWLFNDVEIKCGQRVAKTFYGLPNGDTLTEIEGKHLEQLEAIGVGGSHSKLYYYSLLALDPSSVIVKEERSGKVFLHHVRIENDQARFVKTLATYWSKQGARVNDRSIIRGRYLLAHYKTVSAQKEAVSSDSMFVWNGKNWLSMKNDELPASIQFDWSLPLLIELAYGIQNEKIKSWEPINRSAQSKMFLRKEIKTLFKLGEADSSIIRMRYYFKDAKNLFVCYVGNESQQSNYLVDIDSVTNSASILFKISEWNKPNGKSLRALSSRLRYPILELTESINNVKEKTLYWMDGGKAKKIQVDLKVRLSSNIGFYQLSNSRGLAWWVVDGDTCRIATDHLGNIYCDSSSLRLFVPTEDACHFDFEGSKKTPMINFFMDESRIEGVIEVSNEKYFGLSFSKDGYGREAYFMVVDRKGEIQMLASPGHGPVWSSCKSSRYYSVKTLKNGFELEVNNSWTFSDRSSYHGGVSQFTATWTPLEDWKVIVNKDSVHYGDAPDFLIEDQP